jgi:hypothetical protein
MASKSQAQERAQFQIGLREMKYRIPGFEFDRIVVTSCDFNDPSN